MATCGQFKISRRWWAAALCGASFVTGQMLFGDEPPASDVVAKQPSLLSQYLRVKSRVAEKAAPLHAADKISESVSASEPQSPPTLLPAVVQAAHEVTFAEAKIPSTIEPTRTTVVQAAIEAPLPVESVEEEHLAPIVPSWAVPRPPRKAATTANKESGASGPASIVKKPASTEKRPMSGANSRLPSQTKTPR